MIDTIREKQRIMRMSPTVQNTAIINVLNEIRTMETLETNKITSELQYKWFKKIANSRETSIEIYKNNNRNDLYEKEQAELDAIHHYMEILEKDLPKQLSDEEVEKIIKSINQTNIGAVMKYFSINYPNQNKAKISEIYKKLN